jgi:hypothetical protein
MGVEMRLNRSSLHVGAFLQAWFFVPSSHASMYCFTNGGEGYLPEYCNGLGVKDERWQSLVGGFSPCGMGDKTQ